jgi:hypothetical protein
MRSRYTGAHARISRLAELACALTATAALYGCRGKDGIPASRLYEKAGGFSYVTPDGWTRSRVAGIKYHIVAGPEQEGAAPNLYIMDEKSSGSVGSDIRVFVARQKKTYPDFVVRGSNTLITAAGWTAHVLDASRTARGVPLALRYYFLKRDRRVVVVACAWPASSTNNLANLFTDTVSTFRFEE